MTQLRELALANLAAIRLDAQVDPCVLRQVRAVGERLRALGTFVRLSFTHVNLGVKLQVRLRAKDLQTKSRRYSSIVLCSVQQVVVFIFSFLTLSSLAFIILWSNSFTKTISLTFNIALFYVSSIHVKFQSQRSYHNKSTAKISVVKLPPKMRGLLQN